MDELARAALTVMLGRLLKGLLKPQPAGAAPGTADPCAEGLALMQAGAWHEAAACFEAALRSGPRRIDLLNNLGLCHAATGQLDLATQRFNDMLDLDPGATLAHAQLGNLAMLRHDPDTAASHYRIALQASPRDPGLLNNSGMACQALGLIDAAIAQYRLALEADPKYCDARENLLFCMNLAPGFDAEAIHREARRWAGIHAAPPGGAFARHLNDRDPQRRLRIGYVSPDLRRHAVANFIEPILAHHDHDHFEVHCYHSSSIDDAITARLRENADQWHEAAGIPDERLAQQIREQRIDVLVDLAGHTRGNRLLCFARKPAPVQMTYLGYPNTTGMSAMDYRITDALSDPEDFADRHHEERLLRLPHAQWCYRPDAGALEVNDLPALSAGRVVFGSFNSVAKASDGVIRAWARVLRRVPESQLVMTGIPGESARTRIAGAFAASSVDPARLRLLPFVSDAEFWRLRQDVDLALDPFPYNGVTSTCEALWAGLPVVTLAGTYGPSRSGVALLTAVDLPELITASVDEYVDAAVRLAGDLPRLQSLRLGLRERTRRSPLMNGGDFTRALESLYRGAWQNWVERR